MSAVAEVATQTAAIYARISKDREHDELGVRRQVEALTKLADERGWSVAGTYIDNDISASKGKTRPEYERLLRDIEAGRCDVVLVTEVTRLTRRMVELVPLVDVIGRANVRIEALRAGRIDLSTSGGQLQAHIMGAVAQHEVSQMSERIKAKKSEQLRKGGWLGGSRPFGYDIVNGELKLNKREAKLVRGWCDQVLAGATMTSIALDLNEKGVPTVRGGRWNTTTVDQILRSPRIMGWTSSGGEPVAEAQWEPIVDRPTWERVNAIMRGRQRGPRAHKTLLAGLVYCDVCGQKMYGASRGPNRPRLYQCHTSKVSGRDGCARVSIVAHRTDDWVIEQVLAVLGNSPLGEHVAERSDSDMRRVVSEIAEDEAMLADLATDLGERRIGRAEWLAARGPIEERLHENRRALKAHGHSTRDLPTGPIVDRDAWDALPFEQRREVCRLLIERVTVKWSGTGGGRRWRPLERLSIDWKA